MRYYLILSVNQNIEGKEYIQSSTGYDSLDEAITQWHIALSSYRTKETTIKVSCSIIDENHEIQKREVYIAPVESI